MTARTRRQTREYTFDEFCMILLKSVISLGATWRLKWGLTRSAIYELKIEILRLKVPMKLVNVKMEISEMVAEG